MADAFPKLMESDLTIRSILTFPVLVYPATAIDLHRGYSEVKSAVEKSSSIFSRQMSPVRPGLACLLKPVERCGCCCAKAPISTLVHRSAGVKMCGDDDNQAVAARQATREHFDVIVDLLQKDRCAIPVAGSGIKWLICSILLDALRARRQHHTTMRMLKS